MTVRTRALILLVILTFFWGTNWPLFPLAVREISVWTFRGIAMPAAGIVLLAVAYARGQSLAVPREHWPTMLASALVYLLVWNIASTYAATMIPSGQAAVLGFTMPLWVALISWAVLGERLSVRLVVAIALGALAVGLLMVPSLKAYAEAPLGMLLGLLSGLGWALGTLLLKRRPVPVPATVLTGWQFLIVSVPIVAGAFAFGDGEWFVPGWQTILLVTYITLVPVCIGNVCWFAIVGLLPANVAGLSSIMVPVVAMLSGALIHGEPLGLLQWLAMGCSAGALSLALLKPAATK